MAKWLKTKNASIVLAVFLFLSFSHIVFANELAVLTSPGQVILYDMNGGIVFSFWPNNSAYPAIKIAVGDIDGNKENEIILINSLGINVFSRQGSFLFFIQKANNGANVSIGDVDGDYQDEIIFHPEGDSKIYIYGKNGKFEKDFFLFSKNFRGVVAITTANLNRDNRDEIVIIPNANKDKKFFFYDLNKGRIFSGPKIAENYNIVSFNSGDIEGDGRDEMAMCGQKCRISRLNEEEKKIYEWPDIGINKIIFGNVGANGKREVILGKETGNISIYKFNNAPALLSYFSVLMGIKDMAFLPTLKKEAKVVYVDDGDSIFLDSGEEIRYIGIDTPEIGEKNYLEATNKNKELVYGKTVDIEYDKQRLDPFGRQLAYVFCDGKFINEELIKSGLAKTKFIFPDIKYAKRLEKAGSSK